ncbi:DUF421 domain-containing protein [Alicyclobacillus tolerans]|nr:MULTISPECIES: DUF421 domain-containing protein [Alicyclobacillus]
MIMPIWLLIVRVVILYFFVMIALRIMGKREIGQLSVFDFVVSVMIAEASTLPIEDGKIPLWHSLFAIALLVALQISVAFLQLYSHRFRHWVDGEPAILIKRGEINDQEMKKTRYTMHDLLTQLRQKGYFSPSDVEFAILETSGELSVYPKPHARPVTPADLKVIGAEGGVPVPLVVDGQIVDKSLQTLCVDASWVKQELKKRGFSKLEEVFFAEIMQDGTWYIDAAYSQVPLDRKGNPGDYRS